MPTKDESSVDHTACNNRKCKKPYWEPHVKGCPNIKNKEYDR